MNCNFQDIYCREYSLVIILLKGMDKIKNNG